MRGSEWTPPPDRVTVPDQLDEGAYERIELLEDERIARCWRTGSGFLVMTNLRCVQVWRRYELLAPVEWQAGPSFFFYNLLPPRVLFGRFLELVDSGGVAAARSRVQLRDPEAVRGEIEGARPGGRSEWERRRALTATEMRQRRANLAPPGLSADPRVVRAVVYVRCRYCGNKIDPANGACPYCGAPCG